MLIVAAVVATVAGGGAAVAGAAAGGGDDAAEGPDRAIMGSALDKVKAAALAHVGGGRVAETEVGDEESYYEVEVTRLDGSSVDVQLDRGFEVVGQEGDGAGAEDDD